jgi:hypothetical protein
LVVRRRDRGKRKSASHFKAFDFSGGMGMGNCVSPAFTGSRVTVGRAGIWPLRAYEPMAVFDDCGRHMAYAHAPGWGNAAVPSAILAAAAHFIWTGNSASDTQWVSQRSAIGRRFRDWGRP